MRQLLDPFALRAALAGGADSSGGDWDRLLSVLGVTAALLRDMGAPARVEAALAAQQDVGRKLGSAPDKCAGGMQLGMQAVMQCVGGPQAAAETQKSSRSPCCARLLSAVASFQQRCC